ncbi:MAG: polysaccharide biosynthesis/export family protein [Planctomycetota bacterium]
MDRHPPVHAAPANRCSAAVPYRVDLAAARQVTRGATSWHIKVARHIRIIQVLLIALCPATLGCTSLPVSLPVSILPGSDTESARSRESAPNAHPKPLPPPLTQQRTSDQPMSDAALAAPAEDVPFPLPANPQLVEKPPHGVPRPPNELRKTALPQYVIEPPDILQIEAIHIAPKSPYYLRTFDVVQIDVQRSDEGNLHPGDELQVFVPSAFPHAPINGTYAITPNGNINLGPQYGSVQVAGMTLTQAKQAIEKYLGPDHPPSILKDPTTQLLLLQMAQPIQGNYVVQIGGVINLGMPYGTVHVAGQTVQQAQMTIHRHLRQFFVEHGVLATITQTGAEQEIAGPHLVGPDGMVSLGSYGNVPVIGMTLTQAKNAIQSRLSQSLESPEVAVSVYSYNSKVYYLITQGAGMGDGVYRFYVTGNETVLDAVSQINGLQAFSSKKIWIARPHPLAAGGCRILPVDWHGITAGADASTNYQILPGDRVFVAEDKLVAFDSAFGKLMAPVERLMGFAILGASTATRLSGRVLGGGGNPVGRGF